MANRDAHPRGPEPVLGECRLWVEIGAGRTIVAELEVHTERRRNTQLHPELIIVTLPPERLAVPRRGEGRLKRSACPTHLRLGDIDNQLRLSGHRMPSAHLTQVVVKPNLLRAEESTRQQECDKDPRAHFSPLFGGADGGSTVGGKPLSLRQISYQTRTRSSIAQP